MVYRAQPDLSWVHAVSRAAIYVPLCFGIKSLVRPPYFFWFMHMIPAGNPDLQIMTIDDILDSDIDGLVERTKNRALPRGAITQTRAWIFFFLQVVIGVYLAITCLSPAA
jgi:heme O synthase-like polyprenyltransferase